MKNFLLCFILPFLVISCSAESEFSSSENSNPNGVSLIPNSKIPENKSNVFDTKGKEYYNLLTIYVQNSSVPNSIEETTDQIAFLSKNITSSSLNGRSAISITPEQLALIMNDPENQLAVIVENCSLSTDAKADLISFIQTLLKLQNHEYIEVYDAIASHETSVMESTTLAQDEKETILTVSAVSRYALYAEGEEHRDRDWEISVGNRKAQKVFNSYKASIVSVILLLAKFV